MFSRLALAHAARLINSIMQRTGYVIKNVRHLPNHSYLGLRNIPIKTILDIGANHGQFAMTIRDVFPEAHIFSFEPTPLAFEKLCEMASGHLNWTPVNLALGEEAGIKMMNLHIDHTSSSSLLPSTELEASLYPETRRQKLVQVNCETLDNWAAQNGLDLRSPVLIKMDVQGFEKHVIAGGMKTIGEADAIITEVIMKELYAEQTKFSEIVNLLERVELTFQGMIDHGLDAYANVVSGDALFLREK